MRRPPDDGWSTPACCVASAKGVFVITTRPSTVEQRCAVLSASHPRRVRHRPDGRQVGRAAPDATHDQRSHFSVLHGVHSAGRSGRPLPPDDGDLGDRPPCPRRRHRRRVVATAGLRPRGRPPPARSRLGRPAAAPREAGDDRRPRRHRPPPRSPRSPRLGRVPSNARVTERFCSERVASRSRARRRTPAAGRADRAPDEGDATLQRSGDCASISPCPTSGGASSSTSTRSTGPSTGMRRDARRRRDMHIVAWQIETVTELDMADVEALADELVGLYHARRRRHPSAS